MCIEKFTDDIKNLIKEYIYFTPHNCEIAMEAFKFMIKNRKEATKKYGAISDWDTSMLKIKRFHLDHGLVVVKFKFGGGKWNDDDDLEPAYKDSLYK